MSSQCSPEWVNRLNATGNGADLFASFESYGFVQMKHLASWIILERQFDLITKFLADKFDHFIIRERQPNKIRIEIGNKNPDGTPRMLSAVFDAIEKKKGELSIHEYSISQTSLEQIFNYFASQQEEEVLISGSKQTKAQYDEYL